MDKPTPDSLPIVPFLPLTLVHWYRQHPAGVHRFTRCEGAIVCLDASGFTALTGRLEGQGEDGPEVLTEILNSFFDAIIEVAGRLDGDVLKFSGDGLWLYLPDAHAVSPLAEAAHESLRELNRRHAPLKTHPISLHLGAELGSFELVSFGDPQYRLEVEPVGSAVTEAYACCDRAEPGTLVAGRKLARLQADVTTARREEPRPPKSRSGPNSAPQLPLLWRYVPEALLGRLDAASDSLHLESEYRDVTVVFCHCLWVDETWANDRDATIERVGQIISCARSCGGSLARIDPFKDGHKFLVMFGAPVARSDDQWRALECGRRLASLNRQGFQVRVGAAHGRTFCGAVGSAARMEYTVMGSAANLAARLMSKAEWGTVLFDSTLRALLPGSIVSTEHELRVKGFSQPVIVNHLEHINDQISGVTPEASVHEFRHESYQKILNEWRKLSTSRECCRSIFVHGGHGTGKSHLIRAAERMVETGRFVSLEAKQAIFFGPGYLAGRMMLQLAALNPLIKADDFDHWLGDQGMTDLLPLLKGVLANVPNDSVWTKDLSPQLRAQQAQELFIELCGRLMYDNVSVLLDDLDRADVFSIDLILALIRSDSVPGLTFLITGTDPAPLTPRDGVGVGRLTELTLPSEEEWRCYLSGRFMEGRREEEFINRLIAQSACLPVIVFEVLTERLKTGDLIANPIANKWELRHSISELTVPGSARELHLERFDGLPERLRTILKLGAVNPTGFTIALLGHECGEPLMEDIGGRLAELCRCGILERAQSGDEYRFVNASFKDVIYECAPRADLKAWHGRCAEWVEQHQCGRVALLAHHYTNARMTDKGFTYALHAAKSALSLYALADASHHFVSCRLLLASDSDSMIATKQKIEFHQAYAQFLVLEGRPREAFRTFRMWRRLASRASNPEAALAAALGTAELLWQQSKYGRCTRVLQTALAQVQSGRFPHLVARGMTLLAEVARRTARFSDAESWARKALDVSDEPSALADAYNRLGLALWGQGRLQDAVESLQKSLSSGEGAHSMYNRARVANNLAIVHWQMGSLIKAEPLMREAIQVFKRQGDSRNEAYARGNLAALIREFGKHADARRMLSEADLIFDRLGDRHAHYYTVGNLGDIDLVIGDLDNARRRFTEALAFAEEVSDGELQAECKVRLGEAAFFAGDARTAERSLSAAIEQAEQIGSGEFALRARVGLARVKVGLREIDSLWELANRIRREAQESRTTVMDQEGRFLQGEYFRITGDTAGALRCFEEVLVYARAQTLFELSVKSAVRIAELADPSHFEARKILIELGQQYETDNGPDAWGRLLDSAYFSFFRSMLISMAGSSSPASTGKKCSDTIRR